MSSFILNSRAGCDRNLGIEAGIRYFLRTLFFLKVHSSTESGKFLHGSGLLPWQERALATAENLRNLFPTTAGTGERSRPSRTAGHQFSFP